MQAFLIALGLLAIIWPIIPLRHHTKCLPLSLKASPILVAIMGVILTWGHISPSIPVVPAADVEIVKVEKNLMILNLVLHQARSCRMTGISVYFEDEKGNVHEGVVNLVKNPSISVVPPQTRNAYPKTVVVSVDGAIVTSAFFRTTHECSLDINVISEFGRFEVPPAFNQD